MNNAKKWFLIDGNRLVIASIFVIGTFLVTYGLTTLGFITFRPESAVSTMFGSGIISGIFSLITIKHLAQLSRMLAYIGGPVLLGTFVVTTMYTTLPSTTVAQPVLAEIISLGIAVVFIPLSILLSYILRAASIARYTVSVGPFIPPEEQT